MQTLHIAVNEVKAGDVLLTTLASDHHIIFSDVVTDTYEYDEQQYFRTADNGYYQFDLKEIVSVIRSDYNTDPEGEW